MVTEQPAEAYLGLGSNMGNRKQNLDMALKIIGEDAHISRKSSIYETEPLGNIRQPCFLNMVCQIRTIRSPETLLRLTQNIEMKLGRKTKGDNAPRPIDIDILFYGERIINTAELIIPHPRLAERAFVLVPLAEIAPGLRHPLAGKNILELREAASKNQGVKLWENS